jgi:hypothetical protein
MSILLLLTFSPLRQVILGYCSSPDISYQPADRQLLAVGRVSLVEKQ